MKLDRKLGLLALAVMVTMTRTASAESSSPSAEPARPSGAHDAAGSAPPRWMPLSRFGMTLAGGGGMTAYVESGTRDIAETGGSWAVRMAFRTRRVLGLEVSYIGGASVVRSLGFDTADTKLIRNGVEAAMRFNAPLYVKDTLIEPYFAAGAGWNGYRITNTTTPTASASPSDTNTVAFPLAFGLAVGYKGFVADVRTTFRPTYNQSTLRDQGSSALTNWDLGGMIGFEF